MAKQKKSPVLRYLRDFGKFITSKRAIPTLKGTLAYTLAIALIFIRKYDDLSSFPLSLSAMIIVTIAGGPGKTIGACLQGAIMAMGGVLLGCGFFAILALLASVPVAQAVIFAIIVYFMSILKTLGLKWFAFSLLAILMAFNGIYTSILLNNTFSSTYLLEYLKSYAWGAAIVLAVNILVFPKTSERELRSTIVTSLEHIATFAALIGKGYTLTGTAEDKAARELLSQTIKADFAFLTQKIDETSIEICWSKYTMNDYQRFTDRIRMLQRTLITAHISLLRFDDQDVEVFRDDILPPTKIAFTRLRRDIDLTIREIGTALGCGPMFIEATQSGYLECLDRERAAAMAGKAPPVERKATAKAASTTSKGPENQDEEETAGDDVAENLLSVAKRLQLELGTETPGQIEYTHPDTPTQATTTVGATTAIGTAGTNAKGKGSPISPKTPVPADRAPVESLEPKSSKKKYGPEMIRTHFEEFEAAQKDILIDILTSSDLGDDATLKIHEPGPSVHELYGGDYLRGDVEEGDIPGLTLKRSKSSNTPAARSLAPVSTKQEAKVDEENPPEKRDSSDSPIEDDEDDDEDSSLVGPTPQFKRNETLVRVYSLLFAWDGFVEVLSALHEESCRKRRYGLHFHVYENLIRPGRKAMPDVGIEDHEELQEEARELSIKEALALLENKPFTPVTTTILQKIGKFNEKLSSDTSVFAFKSAAAASVFATLIFAETTRQWFIDYGLTAGLLTCIVALAPTLGQSLLTFVLQVSGSGIGTLVGWTILQIFKGVGGHSYNPYGMCALLALVAVPLEYCIYEKPQLFVLALLALNSAAAIVIIEYINVEYYGRTTFDTPALRAGKFMVSLGVALAIVITFQLFVLRKPARRTLRLAIGNLVYSNLAYNTILQAYIRAVLPADPKQRGKPAVLKRIERELKYREAKMQAQIIEMGPLMAFASAEPSFTQPFRGEIIQEIIQASQIILDRLREGRAAIGVEPFEPFILQNLVTELSPYRRRASRITKTNLYLCATSLMSKSPLPHDSDFSQVLLNQFVHDALLLSSRLVRTEQGARAIREGDDFTRYWFYLISVSGIQTQIRRINMATKQWFGELEDNPWIR
ncbi:hypothetical protein M408DRAFT_253625 [Serendipita vermifera MAFF 305830]|uniref:Uncharacterized protein n=1 Tax=Serendipita vermifera MAFF 305830 TaxID=933852 RepID=A0A0C3AG15_SERVB|nr:hypothetical protein M408DRAFT_253625 [Serendipita vermifera MAFF 305830]